jgi:hypothetical protein
MSAKILITHIKNQSQAHTAKAGKGGETTDDLTAAIAAQNSLIVWRQH